ncbi:MAG: S8 family peptidase [Marinobacter sp.]|uniref:S8 family peptidase n=1 Tax=Marinobacter sp. TaxID=50741 RepID=UPI00299E1BF4|nr:S8 family peptidase [Marinobacter sp.]MDX1756494.1 S8 family peptidase [Marinobacter sp.]
MGLSGCGGGGGSSDIDALSGVITIESRSRVDSDTADDSRIGVAVSNDDAATAQAVPETGTVAGYLSASSGSYGSSGDQEFTFVADTKDTYVVRLRQGDRVVLQTFLSSSAPAGVDMTITEVGGSEICGVDCDGSPPFTHVVDTLADSDPTSHVIQVRATGGGPFRYVLTIAAEGSGVSSNVSFQEPELVPNEAVVMLQDEPAQGGSARALEVTARLSAAQARDLGQGMWRLTRSQPVALQQGAAADAATLRRQTLEWVETLNRQPGVTAEPNYLLRAQAVTPDNDDLYRLQWHYPLISLPVAWQAAPDAGDGIGIAVMDTGLFSMAPTSYGNWHPDIDANVVPFTGEILDYVSGSLDIDQEDDGQRDTNPADPGDGRAQNSSFHGTHVAGIAAGVDNTTGILGVAPQATLYPVRVLGKDGVGSSGDLIAALNWASTRSDIDVINLSLGGLPNSDTLKAAIDQAYANGKLLVAAAGNSGTDTPTYPAAFANVVGVGAVDAGKQRASYSNIGPSVDLVAPGGDASRDGNLDGNADLVISTWGDDSVSPPEPRYAGLQGTSMASPHVAGVYALMKGSANSMGEDVTPNQFFALLNSGSITDDLGSESEYGAGLINAIKAVDAALNGNIPTVLAASPSALQFTAAVIQQPLRFQVYPDGETVEIQAVQDLPPWLSLSPELVVGQPSPAEVQVSVDTSLLDPNTNYAADLRITYEGSSSGQRLNVPITVLRQDEADQRDAGRHYVLLLNTDQERSLVDQVTVEASDGRYRFAFDELDTGQYFLVAGTDMDNNGFICENGEACAEYPVVGLLEPITIGAEPVTGVTMNTSFRRPTLTVLNRPRYGFTGYPVRARVEASEPVRQYQGGQ